MMFKCKHKNCQTFCCRGEEEGQGYSFWLWLKSHSKVFLQNTLEEKSVYDYNGRKTLGTTFFIYILKIFNLSSESATLET